MSLIKSISCYFGSICKKDKEWKLKERVVGQFESQLDVRSFLNVQKNLSLLIWLLLDKQ